MVRYMRILAKRERDNARSRAFWTAKMYRTRGRREHLLAGDAVAPRP